MASETGITNDEARALFDTALASAAAGDYTAALHTLDELEAARPNSRNVTLQRGVCLARMGKLVEAEECRARVADRVEPERLAELEAALDTARATARASAAQQAVAEPDADNVLLVESSFAVSTSEVTVTGHVRKGAFRPGDQLTVPTPDGGMVSAGILRIGPAEMPLQLVRAGQQAVLLLDLEPHLVVNGSYLSSSTKDSDYAATMVVSEAKPAVSEAVSEDLASILADAEKKLRQKHFSEARAVLEQAVQANAQSGALHRLLSRAWLEGEGADRDATKALEHAKRAYELGGADDPAVIGTLAEAEAATGSAAQGLRFLERLFTVTKDPQARAAQAIRLTEFRERHALGHVWEFSDQFGGVVFETGTLSDAAKAIAKGTVPRDGKVRKDRISDWRPIEQALAEQAPEIAALYRPAQKGLSPAVLAILALVLIAAVVGGLFLLFTR